MFVTYYTLFIPFKIDGCSYYAIFIFLVYSSYILLFLLLYDLFATKKIRMKSICKQCYAKIHEINWVIRVLHTDTITLRPTVRLQCIGVGVRVHVLMVTLREKASQHTFYVLKYASDIPLFIFSSFYCTSVTCNRLVYNRKPISSGCNIDIYGECIFVVVISYQKSFERDKH